MERSKAKAFIWLICEQGVRLVNNIIILGAFGKAVGADAFGRYVVLMTVFQAYAAISNFGALHLISTEYVSQSVRSKIIIESFYAVRLLLIAITIIGALIALGVLGPIYIGEDIRAAVWVFVFALPLCLIDYFEHYCRVMRKGRVLFVSRLAAVLVSVVLRLLILHNGMASLSTLAATFVIEQAVCLLLILCLIRRDVLVASLLPKINFSVFRNEFVGCSSQAIAAIVTSLVTRMEYVFVGYYAGVAGIGVYNVSQRFAEMPRVIASAYSASAFGGVIAAYNKEGVDKFRNLVAREQMFLLVMSLVCFSITILCVGPVVEIAYGAEFSRAVELCYILSAIQITYFLSILRAPISALIRRQGKLLLLQLIGLGGLLVIMWVLGWFGGLYGVAFGAVIGYSFLYYAMNIFFSDFRFMLKCDFSLIGQLWARGKGRLAPVDRPL